MTAHLLLVIAAAALFYVAVPAVGAYAARGQWRRFRAAMTEASRYPSATPARAGRERGAPVARCRFFGTLEAIQGDDHIWISNGRSSVAVDLRGVRVFLIPEAAPEEGGTSLASVPWSRIFSLPEGTPMFVGGTFVAEEGRGVFRSRPGAPLLVVIHDCPRESILVRAIGSGRQRNEYMNTLTLPSVGIGSLVQLLLVFTFLGIPDKLSGLIALTAALAPLVPFLPPAFPLYFAYRSAWKKARRLRAQRDVVRLPLRFFPSDAGALRTSRATLLPDMEPYAMIHGGLMQGEPATLLSGGVRIAIPPGTVRLAVDLPSRGGRRVEGPEECVMFGGYRMNDDGIEMAPTEDPMAGLILVPGIPEAIARASDKGARKFTAISALFISLNVAVNAPILFILLFLLMR
jgi:hypothetical protein